MADPITILGAVGTVASIIDILGKSISKIAELRDQWQEADLTMLSLESQLAALNTALNKIRDWIESSFETLHHQLVMDLNRSMACCRLLVNKIDGDIPHLQVTAENRLDVASRFRLLLKSKDFENIQQMIERQTGALILLLTACNTVTLSEQKELLTQPHNRRIFRKIEADTESLLVHRDIDSMLTSYTATSISSSKRSIQFPFDADLFVSRIYQRWIRGSLKKSLHEQQHDTPYPQPYSWSWKEDAERRKRSEAIDRLLEDDSKRLRREIRILLLGSESKAEIVKQMKMNHAKGYSEKELQSYRPTIFTYVWECAGVVASAIRQFGMAPKSDPIWGHTDYISTYVLNPKPYGLDPKFTAALELIRHSPDYAKLMNHSEFHLPDSAEYFFSDLGRIAADDYLPNDMDIMQARTNTTGIADVQFQMGSISIHMFDIANQWSNRKKWIHYFESITSVIFVVDLDTYDQVQLEDCSRNKMLESLMQFDSVVNSKWFADTSIILLLNNVTQFKDKLQRSPLGNYFPDYSGGDDINKAGKYILLRFTQINRAYLDIYPRLIDSDDVANIQLVFAAVKETILNNALKRTSDLLS